MKIKNIYPIITKKKLKRRKIINIVKWPLLTGLYVCPIINILIGGKYWSFIVIMSIYIFWRLVLAPDLVEYNRISQFIKLIVFTCILLGLIDIFLEPGLAVNVIPIVCFSSIIVSGILFFTDFERQKQNIIPMIELILIGIIGSIVGLSILKIWTFYATLFIAIALLIACLITLRLDLIRELKKRFHTR